MENINPTNQVSDNAKYLHDGKIMLCIGIILFSLISIFICIINRRRRHHSLTRLHLPSSSYVSATDTVPAQGLDPSILKTLPTLVYSSGIQDRVLECAVCLSEIQDGEKVVVLPKCDHTFHSTCIDMWFYSHSNCPLCRSPLQSGDVAELSAETVMPAIGNGGLERDFKRNKEEENGCSASSSPVRNISLPRIQCQTKPTIDLISILVEVPATGDQLDHLVDMGLDRPGIHFSNF